MDGYISATAVKTEYGFTDALIKRFLPEPVLAKNPFYLSASPMRMYAVSDVEAAMADPEFAAAKEKAFRRSASAKAAAEARRQAFFDYVNSIDIKVPIIEREALIRESLRNKQDHYDYVASLGGYDYEPFSALYCSDEETIKRWCCNYLRHQCTNYDTVLKGFKGKCGREEGYEIYHNRVNSKIKEAYPYLFDDSPLCRD